MPNIAIDNESDCGAEEDSKCKSEGLLEEKKEEQTE
jgi:hypothetical protein